MPPCSRCCSPPVYVTDAWQTLSMGRWHKPGAAIFPIAVGVLLAISAISVLLERQAAPTDPMPAAFSLPAGADLRRLLLLLAAFAIYFLAMPLIGNMVASALFLVASMWLLSDDPHRSIAAAFDLRHRDRDRFRMVLRAAAEGADARGACSGNGCFRNPVIPGRASRANPESRATTSGFRVRAKSRAPE